MSVSPKTVMKWTSADLELLPENDYRYEIIDGELYVTRAPHWKHQICITKIATILDIWSRQSKLGEVIINPGIIFSDDNNVIPDLIWISHERLKSCVDEAGHFTNVPELVIEVLSQKSNDIKRDKEIKLKLYSNRGVKEYWIVDWQLKQVEVYRRTQSQLRLVMTLMEGDSISSALLPDFSCQISEFFSTFN